MVILNSPFESFPKFSLDETNVLSPPCNYFDVEDIPFSQNENYFYLLLLNIRSCRRNFLNFVCHFNQHLCKYDCIVFTETWLTGDYSDLFKINGFKHYDSCRTQYGGGIRIYVRKECDLRILSDFTSLNDIFEIFSAEVVTDHRKFILSVFYHRPTADHALNNLFIEECSYKLRQLLSTGLPVVTCGDFNLNILNPLRLNYINNFINSMLELGFYPGVTIPTKYNEGNPITKFAILDLVWTSESSIIDSTFVIPAQITDHFPVLTKLSLKVKKTRSSSILSANIQ